MKYRGKLGYIALGGVLMLIGVLAVEALLPQVAQSQSYANFDKITCRQLEVVDAEGIPRVRVKGHGAVVTRGEDGNSILGRGIVSVSSADDETVATMLINKEGTEGMVVVVGKDKSSATMNIGEHGGRVDVFGKKGETDARVTMSVGEVSDNEVGGRVDAFDSAGRARAIMSASENGGVGFGY